MSSVTVHLLSPGVLFLPDTQIQTVPPGAQSDRGNLAFQGETLWVGAICTQGFTGKCPYLRAIKGGRDRKHAFKGGVLKEA